MIFIVIILENKKYEYNSKGHGQNNLFLIHLIEPQSQILNTSTTK